MVDSGPLSTPFSTALAHSCERGCWEYVESPGAAGFGLPGTTLRGLRRAVSDTWQSRVLSDGVSLVFCLNGCACLTGNCRTPVRAMLVGPRTQALCLAGPRNLDAVSVSLPPWLAYRAVGGRLHRFVDALVRPAEVLGPRAAELEVTLPRLTTWQERFAAVATMVRDRCAVNGSWSPEVERAWRLVRQTGGAIRIGVLAQEVALSPRALQSRFREQVGISPKMSARLARIGRAHQYLTAGRSVAEVAESIGYYDQAHFNRDFRDLMRMTPGEYILKRSTMRMGPYCRECESAPRLVCDLTDWPD
jgi:AraC-like DNA-binding protein